MADSVSYYCNQEIFFSLIKNKRFWLTSLTQSNDHLEGQWALNEWLSRFGSSKPERLKMIGARSLVANVLDSNFALGTCFSEDDDLLSQWRGYANDGSGFSVSFSTDILKNMTRRQISFTKINYGYKDANEQNRVLHKLANAFMDDAAKYEGDPTGIVTATLEYPDGKHELQREAVKGLFTIKNEAFHEEKEWRLYLFEPEERIVDLKFRVSAAGLSPYQELEFPSEAIVSVRLGPTNKTPEKVLNAFLKANDINAKVLKSRSSYQ